MLLNRFFDFFLENTALVIIGFVVTIITFSIAITVIKERIEKKKDPYNFTVRKSTGAFIGGTLFTIGGLVWCYFSITSSINRDMRKSIIENIANNLSDPMALITIPFIVIVTFMPLIMAVIGIVVSVHAWSWKIQVFNNQIIFRSVKKKKEISINQISKIKTYIKMVSSGGRNSSKSPRQFITVYAKGEEFFTIDETCSGYSALVSRLRRLRLPGDENIDSNLIEYFGELNKGLIEMDVTCPNCKTENTIHTKGRFKCTCCSEEFIHNYSAVCPKCRQQVIFHNNLELIPEPLINAACPFCKANFNFRIR